MFGSRRHLRVLLDPPRPPSHPQIVSGPPPTHLATSGLPGYVRGSKRPVLNTTTPTLEATYGTAVQATFELVPLDGSAEPDIGSTQARIAGHSSGRSATVVLTGDEWVPVASNVAAGALAW